MCGSSDGGNVRLLSPTLVQRDGSTVPSVTRLFPGPCADRGSHPIRRPT
ncbi:hypothetical protein [Haladaptatus sp. DYF46]|nr:hypothetical protein [Haladaptatus sp. DYF46]